MVSRDEGMMWERILFRGATALRTYFKAVEDAEEEEEPLPDFDDDYCDWEEDWEEDLDDDEWEDED